MQILNNLTFYILLKKSCLRSCDFSLRPFFLFPLPIRACEILKLEWHLQIKKNTFLYSTLFVIKVLIMSDTNVCLWWTNTKPYLIVKWKDNDAWVNIFFINKNLKSVAAISTFSTITTTIVLWYIFIQPKDWNLHSNLFCIIAQAQPDGMSINFQVLLHNLTL